jgi:hypothetical protein
VWQNIGLVGVIQVFCLKYGSKHGICGCDCGVHIFQVWKNHKISVVFLVTLLGCCAPEMQKETKGSSQVFRRKKKKQLICVCAI